MVMPGGTKIASYYYQGLAHRRVTANEKQNHEPNSSLLVLLASPMAQLLRRLPQPRRKRRHAHPVVDLVALANYGLGFQRRSF